jgi:hypothetical protein
MDTLFKALVFNLLASARVGGEPHQIVEALPLPIREKVSNTTSVAEPWAADPYPLLLLQCSTFGWGSRPGFLIFEEGALSCSKGRVESGFMTLFDQMRQVEPYARSSSPTRQSHEPEKGEVGTMSWEKFARLVERHALQARDKPSKRAGRSNSGSKK